jgi:hypothetical protein
VFSPPVGIFEYNNTGAEVAYIPTGGPGVRGVHELLSGDYVFTDDSGLFHYNTTNGMITPIAGGTYRFVSRVFTPDIKCYADCDQTTGNGVLDIFDFLCFGNAFAAGDPYACDCDVSTGLGVCDIFDFLCFGNFFSAGCP